MVCLPIQPVLQIWLLQTCFFPLVEGRPFGNNFRDGDVEVIEAVELFPHAQGKGFYKMSVTKLQLHWAEYVGAAK